MLVHILYLLLQCTYSETLCPDPDIQFHQMMEDTWSQDFKVGEDISILPRGRLKALKNYCNCQEDEEKEPSPFCTSVFASFHSQAQERLKHQGKLDIAGLKTLKLTGQKSSSLIGKDGSNNNLQKFVREVANQFLMDYVVIIVDTEEPPSFSWILGLAKSCLAANLRVTVHLAGQGGNVSQAILQSGSRPTELFLLGRHNGCFLREVGRKLIKAFGLAQHNHPARVGLHLCSTWMVFHTFQRIPHDYLLHVSDRRGVN